MKTREFLRSILAIWFLVLPFASFGQLTPGQIDKMVEQSLKEFQVAGAAVGVVKDGKVIHARGYGVRSIESGDPVGGKTLFGIASNSKAFTTAALAILVDEGLLGWNDKVKKYLPYFELYDPWVSNEVTIRDLLCHRVGLGTFSGDVIWYKSDLTAEEIIKRVKYLPKAYDFRAGYGYSNLMFIAAGEVVAAVSGMPWGEFVERRILEPLGMSRTVDPDASNSSI